MDRWLICFLGNPGKKYEKTRHNLAWLMLEHMDEWMTLAWKEKFKGQYCIKGDLVLLKPLTMMNLSGQSVQKSAAFFQIPIERILVIHDDLELDFGVFRWKTGGGLAGHNGLKSIAAQLKSNDFLRLRLGIGRPGRGSAANWVLEPFSKDEFIGLSSFLPKAAEEIRIWNRDRLQKQENS